MLVKVEGGQFVKDTNNKALLAVNRSVLQENEARKKLSGKLNGQNGEINTLRTQVDTLAKDMSEIKMLLNQLVNSKE
jgi:septal ring factor EnvC (AmiA/AmiB activator)